MCNKAPVTGAALEPPHTLSQATFEDQAGGGTQVLLGDHSHGILATHPITPLLYKINQV